MGASLRMVHLRTVADPWQANVLAARLGSEGIVTELRGNLSRPYPFGAVAVLVEEAQADLAASLLLADEVEAAFSDQPSDCDRPAALPGGVSALWARCRRALALVAALVVAGAPLLARFVH